MPRYNHEHSFQYGKCKWATADTRRTTARKKSSAQPHEPEPKADSEPTAGIPAQVEGRELGADGEAKIAEEDLEVGKQQEASSSSRGPDIEQRVRHSRTYRDQGDNPEAPHDWNSFDIGRVVRLFRTNREGAIRLSLRKLHTRWWHASEHTSKRSLDRVGVSQRVLDIIPEIVQTCRVCREWAKPGPSNSSNVEIADTFNLQVECDLIFIHKFIMFHMIDRCTRWHAAMVIPNKHEETLMKAIDTLWVATHGPPKELITDGESGIALSNLTK